MQRTYVRFTNKKGCEISMDQQKKILYDLIDRINDVSLVETIIYFILKISK